ncbi:alkaline serine protease [Fictibacillus phosphorivorans]|uniref:Alkaline serine protease n=1 Tax=Fictibacillus phosphorivorans TaxID=1221500 RepID=A0A160IKP2_9BACL|nr:S8 family peptidase [Fictibacillus phosphorivorans]ANC76427.1 alkaline serine protease [Fictibacillus phosphorivorans]
MIKKIATMAAVLPLVVSLATPAAAAKSTEVKANVTPQEIIVKFKDNVSESKVKSLAVKGKDEVKEKGSKFHVIKVKDGNVDAAIAEYEASGDVEYAEPNYTYHASWTPNDTYFSNGVQYAPQKVGAQSAWDITRGSSTTKIAIIDTGVDYNHPDLAGKVIKGYDYVSDDWDPMDQNDHGTHAAGIAAAATNNARGIAGMAPNVSIYAVRVLDANGSGSLDDVANGIYHAVDNGAKVVSLSLGGPGSATSLQNAVNYAVSKGVVVVAAAGNENTSAPSYPAYYSGAIAVAATDRNDVRASFSNYGSWVDVAAPGVDIASTVRNGGYAYMSGTSMACPLVAGVAGLLASQGRSAANIRAAIENTTDYVSGTGSLYAKGRVNASKAVRY